MTNIIRWDPFREMVTMRSAMDRLFNSLASESADWPQSTVWNLALDVAETADQYVVKASLPGVKPEDLEITYNANTLTIKGEIKAEEESENKRYHLRERRYGSFTRSITLPDTVKADAIQASYDAGVLTLTLPKAEEAKPKRITVQTASDKVLEGKVADIKTTN